VTLPALQTLPAEGVLQEFNLLHMFDGATPHPVHLCGNLFLCWKEMQAFDGEPLQLQCPHGEQSHSPLWPGGNLASAMFLLWVLAHSRRLRFARSPEAPSIATFTCQNNNACVAQSITEFDTCEDSGSALGGGSCSATDWTCTNGQLTSTGSQGTDTCGGTEDAPSVGYFVCQNNNLCVAETTDQFDGCTDTGDTLGGGSCSAIDWDCNNGLLAMAGNSGIDTCGGTPDLPTVAYWSCVASDGAVADSCVAAQTAQADSCTDTGNTFGGGACGATNWACADGLLGVVETAGTDTCGGNPDAPSVSFWTCQAGDGLVADTCVVDATQGADSCIDSGSEYGGGACSATDWACTDGVLGFTQNAGTDTCGGSVDAPTVDFWMCAATDGKVADRCQMATTEEFDSCSDSGNAFGSGSCSAIDWDCTAGLMTSSANAGVDTCGGTADAPNVLYWTCDASDGNAADLCISATTAREDSCADSGDAFGGGSCSASDWDCTAGTLSLDATSGIDLCGGDVDAPSVTFWSCNASDGGVVDRCLDAVTQKQDICVDSGDASGGGTCDATNWVCVDAVLSATSNSGVDTCGDGSDSQLYYYACAAQDGIGDDYCNQIMDVSPPDVAVVMAPQAVLEDGTTVYQVYCDVADVCDDNPTIKSLVETPGVIGLDTKLKNHSRTSVKFNMNNNKLDIFAPDPGAVLDDIINLAGLPIEEGQSVVVKTHAGLEYHYMFKVMEGIDLLEIKGPMARIWCSGTDDAGHESQANWSEEFRKEQDCGCRCQCDCPALLDCSCQCACEELACACDCDADGNCACENPNAPTDDGGDPEGPADNGNQGVGNGAEGADPGNSNQGDPDNSNDENGGEPGNPGKGGKKK
jgi:hypothetical protein